MSRKITKTLLKPERVQRPAEKRRTSSSATASSSSAKTTRPTNTSRSPTPKAVAEFLNGQLHNRPPEVMCAVYLDTRHRLIARQIAYLGTLNRAAVEPRALLQMALLTNATGIIFAHNYPRRPFTKVAEDLAFTRRMTEAGDLIGIPARRLPASGYRC